MVTPLGYERRQVTGGMRAGITAVKPVELDRILSLLMGRVSTKDFPSHDGDMATDFALAAARAAWSEAGLADHQYDPWRVATVIGSSKGWLSTLIGDGNSLARIQPQTFPGHGLGLEIARNMHFCGPVLNYPAACATGIICIIRAIHALQAGDVDIALAGSGEASGKAVLMASFQNMGALSPEPMLPFDRRRRGFNPGEGAAVFVLEREGDAHARGATILARIAGWDQRADAYHITSADPDGQTVAYSIRRTLEIAGWHPSEVEYINAHGTGTRLNDVVEGAAINRALPGCSPWVSSIKPYIGHLLGASSAAELALALACLHDNYIPATPGLEQPDPDIPLHYVPTGGVNKRVNRFIKLSLGFGGHIGVLALERP
jgi:3-oxoacyl-[acyl-carrier-protein] synthase II